MPRANRRKLWRTTLLACLGILVLGGLYIGITAWRNYHTTLKQFNTPQGPSLEPIWTARLPLSVEQMQMAPDGQSIYLLSSSGAKDDGSCWLAKMDLAGKLLWQRESPLPRHMSGPDLHIGASSDLYVFSYEYREEPAEGSTHMVYHRRLTVFTADGKLRWSISDGDLSTNAVAGSDAAAIAVMAAGTWCYGIDAKGQICWKYQVTTSPDARLVTIPWPSPNLGFYWVESAENEYDKQGKYIVNAKIANRLVALDARGATLWRSIASSDLWYPHFRNDDSIICSVPAEEEDSDNGFPDPLLSISNRGQLEWEVKGGAGFEVTAMPTQDGRVYMREHDELVCYGRDGRELWRFAAGRSLSHVRTWNDDLCKIRSAIEFDSHVLCVEFHIRERPSTGWALLDKVILNTNLMPPSNFITGFHLLNDQGCQISYYENSFENSDRVYRTPAIVAGGLVIVYCDDWSELGGNEGIEAYALPLTPAATPPSRAFAP